jgi:hypothetical protein
MRSAPGSTLRGRLSRARHVERDEADAAPQEILARCRDILLARIEPGDAHDERRRPDVRGQAQVRDVLLSFERQAHDLERGIEEPPVRMKGFESAGIGLFLAGRVLRRPARRVVGVPRVVIALARGSGLLHLRGLHVAVADPAEGGGPCVGLQALESRERLAHVLRPDAPHRREPPVGAALRFLLQFREIPRTPALRRSRRNHQRSRCNYERYQSTIHSLTPWSL